MADLPLLRTLLAICQKSWEPSFWEVMDSFVSLAHECLAASKILLQRLLVCLNFTFRRFTLFVQTKKVISMNYSSSTSSWKPSRWVRLELMLTMRYICINSTLNHSQNSLAAAEALSLKISSHGTSLKYYKDHPISTRIVISYMVKWAIPFWVWW